MRSRMAFLIVGAVLFVRPSAGRAQASGATSVTLTTVADTSTAIPSGTGTFSTFCNRLYPGNPCTPTDPTISAGNVAFWGAGAGQQGIYALRYGALQKITDTVGASRCDLATTSWAQPANLLLGAPHRESVSSAMPTAGSSVVRVYVDEEPVPALLDTPAIPTNIAVGSFRRTAESTLRFSPTFRRQCARIANASHLRVVVDQVIMTGTHEGRAATRIVARGDGGIDAYVKIGSLVDMPELLAHEFEHIIEQLDGVDLVSIARRAATGVSPMPDGQRFETDRAIAVGRRVADEVRQASRRRGM